MVVFKVQDYLVVLQLLFGQVLYGLRSHKGVKDLCYSNGQPVLWDRMEKGMNPEVERFLGWITMNCSPKVVDITF